jgi:hemoglobin
MGGEQTAWNLVEEVGGMQRLEALMRDFYDRLYDDIIIGFLFQPHDKERLIRSQIDYVTAHLGDRSGTYDGATIRKAHTDVPVLPGQFDRRHLILREVLEEHDVPGYVRKAWLELDASLRDFVLNLGATRRDRIVSDDNE